jgi:hypothetical protein
MKKEAVIKEEVVKYISLYIPKMREETERRVKEQVKEEVASYTSSVVRAEINEQFDKIRKEYWKIKKETKEMMKKEKKEIRKSFENAEYMDKFKLQVERYITQEVAAMFSEKGFTKMIRQKVESITIDNFKEILTHITDSFLKNLNEKYSRDLQRTKDLCYSMDEEIKRFVKALPVSYDREQKVVDRINKTIEGYRDKTILKIERVK